MKVRGDRTIAGVYLMVFPVALVLSVVGSYVTMFGLDALPIRPPRGPTADILVSIALNTLPGALLGLALYYTVARRVLHQASESSRHWRRALPLYLMTVLLLSVVTVAVRANPANGMVAQLFIWPAIAALGGAIGDWLAWPSRHRVPAI